MNASRLRPLAAAALLPLVLAGCGTDERAGEAAGRAAAGFPLTLTNCGAEVTVEAPPERVVMLKSSPVTYLHELGVLDRVVARAGAYPREYYDEETWAALEEVPLLTDQLDSGGHLQISKEIVLAERPDLVLGEADNLTRETLAAAGIPLLEEPALCPDAAAEPGFTQVATQLRAYGRVFGVPERGEQAAAEVDERVAAIVADHAATESRTAAVLYPTVGGGTTYAYGGRSMAHSQLEAAGFDNVFADVDERVFEVTREELIGRDPDVLVLLHSDGDPAAVAESITAMSGARALTAVRDGAIHTQLFNFTEPPSPLAVDGLARLVAAFSR